MPRDALPLLALEETLLVMMTSQVMIVCLQNPDHHGFSDDPVEDWQNAHAVLFTSISLTLVFGTLYFRYSPDFRNCNWARREAERLVKQREAAGLPLLSQDKDDRG
uniref:NADH dehydrogenase [ubiquinone] 1 beta subcomplex subunit 11, mitochondrial n=1 Tax=Eptatretus burgeri TaxID=7764 RepID=A0A8C4QR99_EPTBU